MKIPRPYQETGITFLARSVYASLWDEPGLGKTFQTLMAAKKLCLTRILIVCPASVRLVWKQECDDLGLESKVVLKYTDITGGINIVSYDGASGEMYDFLYMFDWQLMVLDEEHMCKGYNSRSIPSPRNPNRKMKVPPLRVESIFGRKCDGNNSLFDKSDRVWGLSGTPMPNDPSELYPMIRAKFPDAILDNNDIPLSFNYFVSRYCKQKNNGFGNKIVGGKNLTKLRDQLRGRVLRRRKKEVAKDLPSMQYIMLPVEGNLSDLSEEELIEVADCLKSENPMKALGKAGVHIASLRRMTGMAKVKSVIKWIEDMNHDKIVVFAHHKSVMAELNKMKNTVHIDGSSTQGQREKAVDAFQNGKAQRLVGQLQAAGTGLTLTAAHTVIFVEYSWVPAENKQAADRIHRIGQENNCLVYFATVPDSVDNNIMSVVKRKLETYEEMGLN